MFRHPLACSAICIALCAASDATAQWVRIGPLGGVSIRVPFVSVDVDPWGGTRVRAPFTAVDAPGHGYHYSHRVPLHDLPAYGYSLPYEAYSEPYHPYGAPYDSYSAPSGRYQPLPHSSYAVPSRPYRSDDRAYEPSDQLEVPYSPYDADWLRSRQESSASGTGDSAAVRRRSLVDAATRLHEALDRRSDGQVWQDYLQPDRVSELAASGPPTTAAGSDAEQLRDLLIRYDGVTANPSLGWVTQLDGFAATRRLLQQIVSSGSDGVELAPATDRPTEAETNEAEELPPPLPEPGGSEAPEVSQTQQRFEA